MNSFTKAIIKQSITALILSSLLSSIGGTRLQLIQNKLLSILPLMALLPALNDLTGDFGCIISSKFTTLLFLGKINPNDWKHSESVKELIKKIFLITIICGFYISILSLIITWTFSAELLIKILLITFITVIIITFIMFLVSILGGLYVYKKNLDPDNFLVPITTSIADLTNMIVFSLLIKLFFS